MNKNKVGALAAAGLMTVGVVGGTLAWFTSWDSVTNVFYTGKNGVEIYEYFKSPSVVVPGDVTPKLVQIKNTANYDSFIRVKFTKEWIDLNETTDTNNIQLNFTDNVVRYDENKTAYVYVNGKKNEYGSIATVDNVHGMWIEHTDGYYYYVGRVPGTPEDDKTPDISFTNTLLESVTLRNNTNDTTNDDNLYQDKKFNVEVIAESIQADNDAYKDLGIEEQRINQLLETYSNKNNKDLDAGVSKAQYDPGTGNDGDKVYVTETDTSIRDIK